jgi:hypothetical protein
MTRRIRAFCHLSKTKKKVIVIAILFADINKIKTPEQKEEKKEGLKEV